MVYGENCISQLILMCMFGIAPHIKSNLMIKQSIASAEKLF